MLSIVQKKRWWRISLQSHFKVSYPSPIKIPCLESLSITCKSTEQSMRNILPLGLKPIQHEHAVSEGVFFAAYSEQNIILYYFTDMYVRRQKGFKEPEIVMNIDRFNSLYFNSMIYNDNDIIR